MALAQRAPVTWPCLHPQRSFCGIVVMSLPPLAVHEVGLYWAFRYRGPAGTMGHGSRVQSWVRESLEKATEDMA